MLLVVYRLSIKPIIGEYTIAATKSSFKEYTFRSKQMQWSTNAINTSTPPGKTKVFRFFQVFQTPTTVHKIGPTYQCVNFSYGQTIYIPTHLFYRLVMPILAVFRPLVLAFDLILFFRGKIVLNVKGLADFLW